MAVEIANSGKPISFYTVDNWLGSGAEFRHTADGDLREGRLYDVFLDNIAPVAGYVNAIRDDSSRAAQRFADGSIDFLYIDASHSYEGVLADLLAWYPKVKEGGIIAGDDWCFADRGGRSVRDAVLHFFGPSADRLTIEPGSAPNPGWLQWSIIKAAAMPVSAAAELEQARLRRKLLRTLTAAPLRHDAATFARRAVARAAKVLARTGGPRSGKSLG